MKNIFYKTTATNPERGSTLLTSGETRGICHQKAYHIRIVHMPPHPHILHPVPPTHHRSHHTCQPIPPIALGVTHVEPLTGFLYTLHHFYLIYCNVIGSPYIKTSTPHPLPKLRSILRKSRCDGRGSREVLWKSRWGIEKIRTP